MLTERERPTLAMMEALAVVGLASSTVQLVDYSTSAADFCLAKSRDISLRTVC